VNPIETRLYISMKEVQNPLGMVGEFGRMLSGLTTKSKGRLAET